MAGNNRIISDVFSLAAVKIVILSVNEVEMQFAVFIKITND